MKNPSKQTLRNLVIQNKASVIPKKYPILALDYGKKFCGFAFSPDGICVFPLEIVVTRNFQTHIHFLLNNKNVQLLVVGLPLQNNNTENKTCHLIRSEIQKLSLSLPVVFINERNSSHSIDAPDKRERHDDLAAAKILEFYLAQK
jgi:RNase H-fold protein (predicted Holliday junction resolvase)